jgi:hypothetical protein
MYLGRLSEGFNRSPQFIKCEVATTRCHVRRLRRRTSGTPAEGSERDFAVKPYESVQPVTSLPK